MLPKLFAIFLQTNFVKLLIEKQRENDMPSALNTETHEAVQFANSFATTITTAPAQFWSMEQSGTTGKTYSGLKHVLEISAAFRPLYKELKAIEVACENWPYDFKPPSAGAIDEGRAFLDRLRANWLVPYRLTASVTGGIGICLRDSTRYADFECDNDGSISALTSDGNGRVDAFEVDGTFEGRNKAIKKVKHFLNG
jgi:hypothetical protein